MTEEERQAIIDEIKEQLLADMVDITKLPKGDATDGASLPVLQHSKLVIQELNNFIGVYDIDVERQSADSDIVNIYIKNAAGVVIKTIVTNAATLEQVNAKVAKINESLTLISSSLQNKQDKLVSGTNIKTINGTSLLGSGDISIEGGDSTGDVDEGRLVWSDDYAPTGTLLDNIMKISGNNVLAFMPPSAITIEYSTDNGVTWLDYGWNDKYKTVLVTPEFGNNGLFLGKSSSSLSSNNRLRITFDFIAANMRFTPSKACIYFSGVNNSDSFYTKLLIEKYNNYNNDVWEELANQKITTGDWGTFRLPEDWGYKGGTYRARFRCEFYRTADSVNSTAIGNVIIMATKIVTANSYAKNHHLYTFDYQQNATFPNAIKGKKLITDGGRSTQVVKGDGSLEEESNLAVASALDAEHAQEADYAGVADKADKLTTARKIGLTGGAVGTATNFDGSGSINIPVTAVNDTHVVYKKLTDVNTEAPYLTLIDTVSGQFTANRLAFKKPENILIEYSNDGGISWTISSHTDETKVNLVSGIATNLYLGNKTTGQTNQDKLRITILAGENQDFYSSWKRLYVFLSTHGAYAKGGNGLWCTYEYSLNKTPDVWVSKGEWFMTGWSGWNKLPAAVSAFGNNSNVNHPYAIRLTFRFEGHASGYENTTRACIRNIELRGDTVYSNYTGCKLAETGLMYDYDWQKNVTFPNTVKSKKHVTDGGTNQQVVLGDGGLIPLSELSPITDADAEILLDNHIHSINVNANGNNVNISVIESTKNGNTWETEDNDITIPLATTTSAGVMSKEDKTKLDGGNVAIDDDSGMPDLIGDYYDDVDMVAEISLRQHYQPLTEGCLYLMNAIEGGSQCIIMFIYRSDGCIPISTTNTNTMKASISGTTLKITGTDGSGKLRIKQIKLK